MDRRNEIPAHVAMRLRETAANLNLLLEDVQEVTRLQDIAQHLDTYPGVMPPDALEQCRRALQRAEENKRDALECINAGRDLIAKVLARPLQKAP